MIALTLHRCLQGSISQQLEISQLERACALQRWDEANVACSIGVKPAGMKACSRQRYPHLQHVANVLRVHFVRVLLQRFSRSAQAAGAQRAQAVCQEPYWKLLMLLMLALDDPLQLSRCHQDEDLSPHAGHLRGTKTSYLCGKPISNIC